MFKDFLFKLNRKLPKGRKTETVQDRMMSRITEGFERKEAMIMTQSMNRIRPPVSFDVTTGKVVDENLYTGKGFEDEFKPPTPRNWKMK